MRLVGSRDPNRKKMKALHWQKIHKSKTKKTVWERNNEGVDINMAELETLFSLQEDKPKGIRVEKKKSNIVHLIELKRSHNISIELSGLKLPFGKIKQALLDMDDSGFSLEQLQVLRRATPTDQEIVKLKAYAGDIALLGSVERYFLEVSPIPRLESRIDALMFKKTFVSSIGKLKEDLGTLKDASNQVLNSKSLKLLLEGVLTVGNYLNTGTARGAACGFKIESLLKLKDIKGKDRKTSLLHFIVTQVIRENERVRFFTAELDRVCVAAKFQKDYMTSTLQQLGLQHARLKEEILHASVVLDETSDLHDRFRDVMVPFAEDSEETLKCMQTIHDDAVATLMAVREYLGEDDGMEPTETFRTLQHFMHLFDSVLLDIRKQEEREKARVQADKKRSTRRSQSVCVVTSSRDALEIGAQQPAGVTPPKLDAEAVERKLASPEKRSEVACASPVAAVA